MKIALSMSVHDIRDPRVTLKIGRGLACHGHQVHLVGGSNDSNLRKSSFRDNFLGTMHWHKLTAGFSKPVRLQRQIEIWQVLNNISPDLLIIPDPELIPLAASRRTAFNTPFIVDIHEDTSDPYYNKNRILHPLVKWALNHADGVIFAFSLERRPRHPLPKTPYAEAFNYYPFTIYRPEPSENKNRSKNTLTLVYTGVLAPERGIDRFISLIEEINSQGQHCKGIMAGRCYYPDFLAQLRERLSAPEIQQNITLYGGSHFISWFRLQEILERADLGFLIYPGGGLHHELPTKIYEYAAHHIPVVCSSIPSFKNFIQKYGSGICLQTGDISEQASRIIRYWQNMEIKTVRKSFGKINKKTWESQLQKVVELINQIETQ